MSLDIIVKRPLAGIGRKVAGKIPLTLVVASIFVVRTASAAAPLKIDLGYDHESKILHVDVTHPTHDRNKHYIKKIVITKNDEAPVTLYSRQQVNRAHFLKDIPLEAQPGDVIRVAATDSDGGSKTETIVVPEPEE